MQSYNTVMASTIQHAREGNRQGDVQTTGTSNISNENLQKNFKTFLNSINKLKTTCFCDVENYMKTVEISTQWYKHKNSYIKVTEQMDNNINF